MEHPEFSDDEIVYSLDFLVAIEEKTKRGKFPTSEEEKCLSAILKKGVLDGSQEQRVIAILNPEKAPVVVLNAEQRKEHLMCSHGTNYRVHLPRGGWGYDMSTLVFDRNTGLYYIQRPEGIEILE